MRDITWQMFELTGDIDAYLLYRAVEESDVEAENVSQLSQGASFEEGVEIPPS